MASRDVMNWAALGVCVTVILGAGNCFVQSVNNQIAELREDNRELYRLMNDEIAEVNKRMDAGFAEVNKRMDAGFAEMREDYERIYDILLELTRDRAE